jgi:hypothetical protein
VSPSTGKTTSRFSFIHHELPRRGIEIFSIPSRRESFIQDMHCSSRYCDREMDAARENDYERVFSLRLYYRFLVGRAPGIPCTDPDRSGG